MVYIGRFDKEKKCNSCLKKRKEIVKAFNRGILNETHIEAYTSISLLLLLSA